MRNTGPARLALLAMAMAIATLLGSHAPAHGVSFTVNATHDAVDASPGDGVCADAGGACTLRAAVMETNALPGADVIKVAPPSGPPITFEIPGPGEEASISGDLDITDNVAIDGLIQASGDVFEYSTVDGAGLDRVFDIVGSISVEINGLSIQHGTTTGDFAFGGGIRNTSGELVLERSVVQDNSAGAFGGGVFSGANTTTVLNGATIQRNSAEEGGGVFTVSGSDVSLLNSTIGGNSANNTGGGIANGGFATLKLTDTFVNGNSAEVGGGIANYGAAEISRTTIIENSASSPNAAGIQSGGGSLALTNSTVAKNSGAALVNGGSFATEPVPNTVADLVNVTISSNDGAAIVNGDTGELRATNITAAFNRSGVANLFPGAVTLTNTIVAFNDADGDCSGAITSAGHNLDSDGTCTLTGTGDISNADPQLMPLANNGGPTQTHALRAPECGLEGCTPGSPAIDAADNAACPATDQRGVARPFDGDGDGNAACDIGAHENDQGVIVCGCLPTASPSPAPTPNESPVLPAALPNTGGPETGDRLPLRALIATFPALAADAAVLWRAGAQALGHSQLP